MQEPESEELPLMGELRKKRKRRSIHWLDIIIIVFLVSRFVHHASGGSPPPDGEEASTAITLGRWTAIVLLVFLGTSVIYVIDLWIRSILRSFFGEGP